MPGEETSEPSELMGADRDACKNTTITYDGKPAGPMVAAAPHSLVSKIFGNREGV